MSADRLAALVAQMRAHLSDVADVMMSQDCSTRDAKLMTISSKAIGRWADELESMATESDLSPAEKMRAHLQQFGK